MYPFLSHHELSGLGFGGERVSDHADSNALDRLRRLWDGRFRAAQNAGSPAEHRGEIGSFGLWFLSGRFPDDWALEQLHKAIKLVGWIKPEDRVLERLAELAEGQPAVAVDCLGRLFRGIADPWRANLWIGHAHTILGAGLRNTETRPAALELVNVFGEAGYIDQFRDLAE